MTRKPHPPEWLFLLALCAVSALAELGFVIVNISSLPMLLEQGLGLASLPGIAMAIFYTAEAVGNSPMGALADRVGRRMMMFLGAMLCLVLFCFFPLCTSYIFGSYPPGAAYVCVQVFPWQVISRGDGVRYMIQRS